MGRPIHKTNFGNTATSGQQLTINAWMPGDTQARTGFIIAQKGTGKYYAQTTDGNGNVFANTVSIGNAAPTAAGQAAILVTPFGASGSGAVANAIVGAQSVNVAVGGHGYTVGDSLTFSTGWTSNAVVTVATTTGNGAIATVTIASPGARFALPSNPVSADASNVANVSAGNGSVNFNTWFVEGVNVAVSGSGYNGAPFVNFTISGSVTPAAAQATVTNGSVSNITVNSGGVGYVTVPLISFTSSAYTQYARKINDDTVVTWGGNVYTWYAAGTTLTAQNQATLPTA